MLTSLVLSAFFMGVAGLPHCAAMCAAPCTAVLPHGISWPVAIGRSFGYAVLGALAAQATAWLAAWSAWAVQLQPVWVMALTATVLLGSWMLLRGQLPPWLVVHGTHFYRRLSAHVPSSSVLSADELGGWPASVIPIHAMGPDAAASPRPRISSGASAALVSGMLGMSWAALPCGLLYSALVAAALAPGALQGATVMLAFSLPGGLLIKWLPFYWQRHLRAGASRSGQGWMARLINPAWAIRLSGATLALAAGWALGHRLMAQWQVWCA